MGRLNIKTSISTSSPAKNVVKATAITRGESAILSYNLYDKWFSNMIDIIEQVTFILKQPCKDGLRIYSMRDYIKLSEDTEIDESTVYYSNVSQMSESTHECTGEVVTEYDGNPSTSGWYEGITLDDTDNTCKWILDSHFTVEAGKYPRILFMLSPSETASLKATDDNEFVQFEVAIKFNTDQMSGTQKLDSILIDKQPQIIVLDSLYGDVVAENDRAICSNTAYCSNNLLCGK